MAPSPSATRNEYVEASSQKGINVWRPLHKMKQCVDCSGRAQEQSVPFPFSRPLHPPLPPFLTHPPSSALQSHCIAIELHCIELRCNRIALQSHWHCIQASSRRRGEERGAWRKEQGWGGRNMVSSTDVLHIDSFCGGASTF